MEIWVQKKWSSNSSKRLRFATRSFVLVRAFGLRNQQIHFHQKNAFLKVAALIIPSCLRPPSREMPTKSKNFGKKYLILSVRYLNRRHICYRSLVEIKETKILPLHTKIEDAINLLGINLIHRRDTFLVNWYVHVASNRLEISYRKERIHSYTKRVYTYIISSKMNIYEQATVVYVTPMSGAIFQ